MWPKHQSRQLPVFQPPQVTPGLAEARAARSTAANGLHSALDRQFAVREVVDRVADHGRRNHFFDLLAETLQPNPRSPDQ